MDLPKLTVAPDDEPRFRALMEGHHCLGASSETGQTVWYDVSQMPPDGQPPNIRTASGRT